MRTRRGFTLLELLVALAMSVVVAGALASSLYTAYRARRSAEQTVEATRATDMAAEAVTRDLANCLPKGVLADAFDGAADDVIFYASGPDPKAEVQGDVRKVEFALLADETVGKTGPRRQVLVRRVTSNLLAPVQSDPPDEVLCRDVALMTFRYYDGSAWQDTWDPTEHNYVLPSAVEFTLELAPLREGEEPRRTVRLIPISCAPPVTAQTSLTGGG